LHKFNPEDSESEVVGGAETGRSLPRRKESLDRIETELVKAETQRRQKLNRARKVNGIRVEGDNVPYPLTNFTKMMNQLSLDRDLIG
jgi:hypothetical protein